MLCSRAGSRARLRVPEGFMWAARMWLTGRGSGHNPAALSSGPGRPGHLVHEASCLPACSHAHLYTWVLSILRSPSTSLKVPGSAAFYRITGCSQRSTPHK